MLAMLFWIIQYGFRWGRLWQNLAEYFCICFEQGIHGFDQLPRDTTYDPQFSFPLARSLIIRALRFDEPIIQFGPLRVSVDQVRDNQKHHLFHSPRSSASLTCVINTGAGLDNCWRPSKVRFEASCVRKVLNRSNSGDDCRGLIGPIPRDWRIRPARACETMVVISLSNWAICSWRSRSSRLRCVCSR